MPNIPDVSFMYGEPEPLPSTVLDRTPVERYRKCPFQGWACEFGFAKDASPLADSGIEAHEIIAGGVLEYVEGRPPRDFMEQSMGQARPDVQQDVRKALRRGLWMFSKFLHDHNPADMLRFQGGPREQGREGQIAWELLPATDKRGAIEITTEFDLLMSGASEEELIDIDTKSGNKVWTSGDVKESFQFNCHAWLAFNNYPIKYFHVQIFMPRMAAWSPRVTWTRKEGMQFAGVLFEAVEYRRRMIALADQSREKCGLAQNIGSEQAWYTLVQEMDIEARGSKFNYAWPGDVKCDQCAATHLCPRVLHPSFRLNEEPVKYAQDTMAMQVAIEKRKDHLIAYVEKNGAIQDESIPFAWGVKSSPPRKPTRSQYGRCPIAPKEQEDGEL